MSVAIHYTAIKPLKGQEGEVFGLQVAIADLLTAYFRYARAEKFLFLIADQQEWQEVQNYAIRAGIDAERLVALDRRFPEKNYSNITTIFRPEPDTQRLLWQRQFNGHFAFCGLAHAMSGVEAGEVLQEYCLAPSRDTDAIICPSRAVKSAIRSFWDQYSDYLNGRFGITYQCSVQLPVIPLGVDTLGLMAKVSPHKRADQRLKLGVMDDDIVVLWVGRLSAAIKAHPLAMLQAAEYAAGRTSHKVHLVMVGYFLPEQAKEQFQDLATDICHQAKIIFIAANDQRFPDGLWAAGDIFLSLVDNMQESFGLTPIEAMAAGLPRVVSDWDGYRDSVADGEDGFLIRTMQPPPGNGSDLTMQVLNGREVYGGFLAKSALTVAVDSIQAGDRLAQLINDKNLRLSMAAKARERAQTVYDWRHIIPIYENIWTELSVTRQGASHSKVEAKKNQSKVLQNYTSAWPVLPDPYSMYSVYSTQHLEEDNRLFLAASLEQIKTLWRHSINTYANDILVSPLEITALLGWLNEVGDATIAELFAQFYLLNQPRLWRTIAWLQKLGIIKNSACQSGR